MQLLEMAIADLAAGLVAFPDEACILGGGVSLGGVDEGRVPAPGIGAGETHAALEKWSVAARPMPQPAAT